MTPTNTVAAQLTLAITSQDVEEVRRLLTGDRRLAGAVNRPLANYVFGTLPIVAAAATGNRQMLDVLLAAGADVNARNVWWAGGRGVLDVCDRETATFLIGRGARIDVHAAARLGMAAEVEAMIDRTFGPVTARGPHGKTALHCAATVEVARILLDKGADIEALDLCHDSTPAQHMIGAGPNGLDDRRLVAEYLGRRGCRTDIIMASALDDRQGVAHHLRRDAHCISTCASDEWFPRRTARSEGSIYIWSLGWYKTPLLIAHERRHAETFDLLWAASPDALRLAFACTVGAGPAIAAILARHGGRAPLAAADRRKVVDAAQNDDAPAVRRMLAAGWPIDARGHQRATVLHWAAWNANAALVAELVERGADVNERDETRRLTPLDWAVYASQHRGHREHRDYDGTIRLLAGAGACTTAAPGPTLGRHHLETS